MTLTEELALKQVNLNGIQYNDVTEIGGGACATVYSGSTAEGRKVALKIFDAGTRRSSMDTRSKYNHFGKTRDISNTVFNEVMEKRKTHPFLLDFISLENKDNCWILVTELAEGVSLKVFLNQNSSNLDALNLATFSFGQHLRIWHDSQFAHGDPHLDNVMYDAKSNRLCLVDLNMFHHPDFECCKWIGCSFDRGIPTNRLDEDLENTGHKVGGGFLKEIKEEESKLGCAPALSQSFLAGYCEKGPNGSRYCQVSGNTFQ
jgi:serine/threonine protein kinase